MTWEDAEREFFTRKVTHETAGPLSRSAVDGHQLIRLHEDTRPQFRYGRHRRATRREKERKSF